MIKNKKILILLFIMFFLFPLNVLADNEVFRKPTVFNGGLETQANGQLLSNCQANELQSLVGDKGDVVQKGKNVIEKQEEIAEEEIVEETIFEKQMKYKITRPNQYKVYSYDELVDALQESFLNGKEAEIECVFYNASLIDSFSLWDDVFKEYLSYDKDYLLNSHDSIYLPSYYTYEYDFDLHRFSIVPNKRTFYLKNLNYSYNSSTSSLKYINEKMDEVIDSFDFKYLTTYEKVKMINDWIINNFEYDYNYGNVDYTKVNNNIKSGFDNKTFICSAYTTLFYNLLNRAGISNRILYGEAGGSIHNWSMVQMEDSKWYFVDTTWNDTSSQNNFFLIGSYQQSATHSIYNILKASLLHYDISTTNYVYTPPVNPIIASNEKDFNYTESNSEGIKISNIFLNDAKSFKVFINNEELSNENYKEDTLYGVSEMVLSDVYLKTLDNGKYFLSIVFDDERITNYDYNLNINIVKSK